jgi:hypothetical protein
MKYTDILLAIVVNGRVLIDFCGERCAGNLAMPPFCICRNLGMATELSRICLWLFRQLSR